MSDRGKKKALDRVRKHRALARCRRDLLTTTENYVENRWLEGFEDAPAGTQSAQSTNPLSAGTQGLLHNPAIFKDKSEVSADCRAMMIDPEDRIREDIMGHHSQATDEEDCPIENLVEGKEIHQIREWAISRNIKHSDLDELLSILRVRLIPNLPKTSKTFLQTCTEYDIFTMEDTVDKTCGEFVYFGIEDRLRYEINADIHTEVIELQINIAGMQVFKSGGKHFWPILCKVHFIPDIYKPFPVAIYSGTSKPADVHDYLAKFVAEINHLQAEGIVISGKHFVVSLKCFVCDTPARTYIKCTKGHGGYSACERCTCYGVRVQSGKGYTVVYPEINCPKRTEKSFREVRDPDHHIGISPLLEIQPPLDISSIFVIDYMHLLGVVKKLLTDFWLGSNLKTKLGRRQREELSRRLLLVRAFVPCEFQRKTRSIYFVHKWKATEFRYFLLYCGPIVLKNLLPRILYEHFLLLHVAFRILCSDELAIKKIDLAKLYLDRFVEALPYLYGQEASVINMHNLSHVTDDVRKMGCSLSRISCFPFENMLGQLGRTIRTPNLLLSQICRRLQEKNAVPPCKATLPTPFNIIKSKIQNDGHIIATKICINGVIQITTKIPDNLVMMKDGQIVEVSEIIVFQPTAELMEIKVCRIWKTRKPIYTYPCASKILKSWELVDKESSATKLYRGCDIHTKMVRIPFSAGPRTRKRIYVMPLLHT